MTDFAAHAARSEAYRQAVNGDAFRVVDADGERWILQPEGANVWLRIEQRARPWLHFVRSYLLTCPEPLDIVEINRRAYVAGMPGCLVFTLKRRLLGIKFQSVGGLTLRETERLRAERKQHR